MAGGGRGGHKLAPTPPYTNVCKFLQLSGAISSLAQDVSLSNLAILLILRRSLQWWRRVFSNWSLSKVEKTVEGSITVGTNYEINRDLSKNKVHASITPFCFLRHWAFSVLWVYIQWWMPLFPYNIELLYYNHYRTLMCIFLSCKAVYFSLIKRFVSLPLPFSPLQEDFRLTVRFCLSLFSIEPVETWNCEILLTASLDCTVRLWTMEGHFVGELFSWTRFLSVNSINFQRIQAVGPTFILWSGRHAEACPILSQFCQDSPHDPLVFVFVGHWIRALEVTALASHLRFRFSPEIIFWWRFL